MRELARIRDFRLLFAGLLAMMAGDLLLTLMLAVWVQKLTGSDGAAGITFGCGVVAYAVSPLIAWPADRIRRRPLVISANVGTAAIIIPLLTVHHAGRIWVIYAVAVAYGIAAVIAGAASQGLIGLIVPAASMPDAYGALQTARQTSRVFVPVLGVALYTRVGPAVVVVLTVVSLLASAAAIAAIRAPDPKPDPAGRRWIAEMTAGARQLASDRVLTRITVGNSSAMLAAGAFAVLGFAVVTEGLGRPAAFFSVLISVQAGTAIVGAMLSARIVKRVGEIAATAIAFALGGAGIFLTVFPSLAAVIGAYALAGFAVPLGGVSAYNALQHRTPGRLFARTMVAFTSAVSLPQAIGIPAAAVLLVTVGFRTLILICFAITMLASAYVWRGRGLTQPSRRATLAAHPLVETPCTRRSPSQPATLARRRQSRQLGIGGGIVGSGAVLVNARNIRTFDDRVGAIAHAAVRAGTPIWLGVKAGSLDKRLLARYGRATAEGLVESALCECSLFGENGFTDIKISVQHHDPVVMTNADRQLAARCDYPPYLGVTGAGLRVPLPASPVEEVKVGIATLESLGLRESGLEIVSCPSCGRAKVAVPPMR
jgi:MFS family permease